MFSFYLFLHLLGYGLLISVLIVTPVLEWYLRRTENHNEAEKLTLIVSRIGLISPLSVLLLLISGILMMSMRGYGIFTEGWLTAKLLIFLVMVVTGVYMSVNLGKQRRDIYRQMIDGKDDPTLPGRLIRAHNKQSQYIRIQAIFMIMILLFTVYKP